MVCAIVDRIPKLNFVIVQLFTRDKVSEINFHTHQKDCPRVLTLTFRNFRRHDCEDFQLRSSFPISNRLPVNAAIYY